MSISQSVLESNKNSTTWARLFGASLPLALSELFKKEEPQVHLCVTENMQKAEQLLLDLRFFLSQNKSEILLFPDWETLPYDHFSPHEDLVSERLATLSKLHTASNIILITSTRTLMHYLCPTDFVSQFSLVLKIDDNFNIDIFRLTLQKAGYYIVNQVLEHGEYAVRGSIFDLYPMGSKYPYRIELFDNTIESIRVFDPDTQRTIDKVDEIKILPAREFLLSDTAITKFRNTFREIFPGNPSLCPIYNAVSEGRYEQGIEYYLPLFFEKTATLFDYLPQNANIIFIDDIPNSAEAFWQEASQRYEQLRHDVIRPILPPQNIFLEPSELFGKANNFQIFKIYQYNKIKKNILEFNINPAPKIPIDRKSKDPLGILKNYVAQDNFKRFLFVAESAGRREIILDYLKEINIAPKVETSWDEFILDNAKFNLITAPIIEGAELIDEKISIIVESQLFGESVVPQRRSTQKIIDPEILIKSLAELKVGMPVVHLQFGVGRYLGLQTIEYDNELHEFLVLVYANDDKIYVPVTSLYSITRYSGADSDSAPLHRLGTGEWEKTKKKAAEKIHDIAVELLEIYAKRASKPGHAYKIDEANYKTFAESFAFTETPHQIHSIEQILEDLKSNRPMDRLICGDVGFGKTEVAMRAAFVAVFGGKQVCVLVPTTLLAGQHFETFRDRFAEFAVRIELLSRFRSTKESEDVIKNLEAGKIDIIIGTHKLLQKNIKFKNLGLLIIDEEHRFGVKQKENLKAMREHIDVLSMTATPIPRTLNMALSNIRDVSLITTPPAKRLAVKTFWQTKNSNIIREAIFREISRGGQVFYVHNKVQTMMHATLLLQKLVPEANISMAHGQMRERELERIMSDFYHHKFNVLVCSTIIENGIDIPTANTIIIDRADEFGLAQLHQLRGRVGRSHHQAYAYLFTPEKEALTPDAIKRLDAIIALEGLGVGFSLATHDLEIRGAGELLGQEQSGNMHAVGFDLFMQMLEDAVSNLKSGKAPRALNALEDAIEIDLAIPVIIPENYIGDPNLRLILYKRIASVESARALEDLQTEMIDRFGVLPESVKNLFAITELKWLAKKLKLLRINATKTKLKIIFSDTPNIDAAKLINLIKTEPNQYKLEGPHALICVLNSKDNNNIIKEIKNILNNIKAPENSSYKAK